MNAKHLEIAMSAAPALGPVTKTLLQHRLQRKTIEAQKNAEMEVIETKARATDERNAQAAVATPTPTPQKTQPASSNEFSESISALKDGETCQVCLGILDAMDSVAPEDRGKALAEYGQLKHVMDTANSEDELVEFIDQTEVLDGVMGQL